MWKANGDLHLAEWTGQLFLFEGRNLESCWHRSLRLCRYIFYAAQTPKAEKSVFRQRRGCCVKEIATEIVAGHRVNSYAVPAFGANVRKKRSENAGATKGYRAPVDPRDLHSVGSISMPSKRIMRGREQGTCQNPRQDCKRISSVVYSSAFTTMIICTHHLRYIVRCRENPSVAGFLHQDHDEKILGLRGNGFQRLIGHLKHKVRGGTFNKKTVARCGCPVGPGVRGHWSEKPGNHPPLLLQAAGHPGS